MYENTLIVDPYVEKGLTPELKLTLAAQADVDAVEDELNIQFPTGYREFVTTFGKGSFFGPNTHIWVSLPTEILAGYHENRRFLEQNWFWEESEELLPYEKAIECIKICGTDLGDVVIFHPSNPREIFVLPRSDDELFMIGSDLAEVFEWLCVRYNDTADVTAVTLAPRYFFPDNPLAYDRRVVRPEDLYDNLYDYLYEKRNSQDDDLIQVTIKSISYVAPPPVKPAFIILKPIEDSEKKP